MEGVATQGMAVDVMQVRGACLSNPELSSHQKFITQKSSLCGFFFCLFVFYGFPASARKTFLGNGVLHSSVFTNLALVQCKHACMRLSAACYLCVFVCVEDAG